MKQITAIILLFLCGTGNLVRAQEKFSTTFGKITQYEADMAAYDTDPEAEAVVIYESGNTYFRGNDNTGRFEVYMERSIKIKILKQAGLDYANFKIPYYMENNDWESIERLEGQTYNWDNGKLITDVLEKKNIFTEKINANWSQKVFAMPNIRVGSIIELKYTIVSPFYFNVREWEFQKRIPVIQSTYEINVIPYFEYSYIMKGSQEFDKFDSEISSRETIWGNLTYKEQRFTFKKNNIPAFRDESFISSDKDYMISLNFQLSRINYPRGGHKDIMTTWPAMSDDFLKLEHFGKYIKAAEKEGKKIISTLGLDGKSKDEQIKIISEYVKSSYQWNHVYSKYSTDNLALFLKEKRGNSTDINLFFLGLLKAAQIDAQPVMLSTREHGAISQGHPFVSFFNYVIVSVGNAENCRFFDATESFLEYDELPDRCINVRGLVIAPKSDQWVTIVQDDLALTEKKIDVRCNENNSSLNIKTTLTAYAYDAYYYRNRYNGDISNLQKILQGNNITPTGTIRIENAMETDKPFIFSFDAQTNIDHSSGKLFIPPFVNQSETENIFKQNSRTLPIDLLHRRAAKYQSTIHIPEGYEVESLPKNVSHDGKIMKIDYKVIENNGVIEVTGSYEFVNSMYDAKYYGQLKAIYNLMIQKFNDMIVLKKKETSI